MTPRLSAFTLSATFPALLPGELKVFMEWKTPQVHSSKLAILVLHPFLTKPHFQVLSPCVDSGCLSPTSPRPAEPTSPQVPCAAEPSRSVASHSG